MDLQARRECWRDVVVCSYYTAGAYEEEVQRLQASAVVHMDLPLSLDCFNFAHKHTWEEAVKLKPGAILSFMDRHPGKPLLFVDADAILLQDPRPHLPNTWEHSMPDVSVHCFDARPCSGTVIVAPTEGARQALKEWQRRTYEAKVLPRQPQWVLEQVSGINMLLEPRWCWIFDLSLKRYGDRQPKPIVLHTQASRENRNPGTGNIALLRNRRQFLAQMQDRSKDARTHDSHR